MATANLNDPQTNQTYRKAIEDFQRKFAEWLRSLPEEIAKDLCELFQAYAKAEEDGDEESRATIAQAINEILMPDSIKVDLEREFLESDLAARHRLDAYRANVGMAIRKQRELLGLTQDQLADIAGIPQSHVSRLECGRHVPTSATMEKLANALQVAPCWLDPGFPDC